MQPVYAFMTIKIIKWYTLYLHLHDQQLVVEGQVVHKAGDLIGTLGDSGVHIKGWSAFTS
jgi:hypothetical protein